MLFVSVLLSLLSLLSFSAAETSTNGSAVFEYYGVDHTSFLFALNVDKQTGDVYFHLESDGGSSWVGVGIGSEMKDSLMFIAYPGSNGHDVTISPRIASGHSEPTFQKDLSAKLEKQSGPGLMNLVTGSRGDKNIMTAAVCRRCASWRYGGRDPTGISYTGLDLTSTAQPFIFAVGGIYPEISSDSQSAGLSRHDFYGHFTMDMTAATSPTSGEVPTSPWVMRHASQATGTTVDNDPAPRIHGLVMSIVFIILLPLGATLLRVWNKVKGHIIVQCIGLVLFCMAVAGGSVVSTQYNRSKNFNSAHQVIGILLLLALLSQLVLGILNHRIFKKEQRKTIMGKIHRYLGPAIIFFGLVNGAIGFAFAGASFLILPYCIAILLFVGIFTCIRVGSRMRRKRKGAKQQQQGPEGYQYPQFGNNGQAQYAPPNGAPPNGAYPPPYSQQDVPLQSYHSSQSINNHSSQSVNVPSVDDRPVEARPMV